MPVSLCEILEMWEFPWGAGKRLSSHKTPSVYNRQFSFLPTIMREIESQEMFVFASIRPNNNTEPPKVYKDICLQRDHLEN